MAHVLKIIICNLNDNTFDTIDSEKCSQFPKSCFLSGIFRFFVVLLLLFFLYSHFIVPKLEISLNFFFHVRQLGMIHSHSHTTHRQQLFTRMYYLLHVYVRIVRKMFMTGFLWHFRLNFFSVVVVVVIVFVVFCLNIFSFMVFDSFFFLFVFGAIVTQHSVAKTLAQKMTCKKINIKNMEKSNSHFYFLGSFFSRPKRHMLQLTSIVYSESVAIVCFRLFSPSFKKKSMFHVDCGTILWTHFHG